MSDLELRQQGACDTLDALRRMTPDAAQHFHEVLSSYSTTEEFLADLEAAIPFRVIPGRGERERRHEPPRGQLEKRGDGTP